MEMEADTAYHRGTIAPAAGLSGPGIVQHTRRTMATGKAEIDINGTPEEVWKIVGDFGGVASWMPGMESCRLEGDDRILETMGMTITERLLSKDDGARAITYGIIDGVPVETHQATITVTGEGDSSHVDWVVESTPDEMADLMVGVYQGSLDTLKAHIEG